MANKKKQTYLEFLEESALMNLSKYSNPGVDILNWRGGDETLPTSLRSTELDDIVEKIAGTDRASEPAQKITESDNLDEIIENALNESMTKDSHSQYQVVSDESHLIKSDKDNLAESIIADVLREHRGTSRDVKHYIENRDEELYEEKKPLSESVRKKSKKVAPLSILEDSVEGDVLSRLINEMESIERELDSINEMNELEFGNEWTDEDSHRENMLDRDDAEEADMRDDAIVFDEDGMDVDFAGDEEVVEDEVVEDEVVDNGEEVEDLGVDDESSMEDPEELADVDADSEMASDELDELDQVEDTLDDMEDGDVDDDDLEDLEESFSLLEMDEEIAMDVDDEDIELDVEEDDDDFEDDDDDEVLVDEDDDDEDMEEVEDLD